MNKRRVNDRRQRMSQSRRKNPAANLDKTSFPFVAIVDFICVILLVIHRVVLANRSYDDANGYSNIAIALVLIICGISIFPIKKAEFRLIRSRIKKDQVKNIGTVLRVSLIFSCVVNGILSSLIFLFSSQLSHVFFGNTYGAMSFQYIAFFPVISSVASILMGFFDGYYEKEKVIITRFLYVLFLFLFVMIFSDKMQGYGTSVSNFLKTDVFIASYTSAGVCFGILLAGFVDVLALFVFFMIFRNSLKLSLKNDRTKNDESDIKILKTLLSNSLQDYLHYLLILLPVFFGILFYCMTVNKNSDGVFIHELGIFFGKFFTIFLIPLTFSILSSDKITEYVWNAYEEKSKMKVRAMCGGEMKLQAGFMALFVGVFLCLSKPLCKMLYHYGDVDQASLFLQKSAFVLLVYTLGITAYRLLLGVRRNSQAYLSLGLACFISLAVEIICIFGFHLGLDGLLIGSAVFGICLLVLSLNFLQRFVNYHQEWIRTIVIPVVVAIIISLIARLLYVIFDSPLGIDMAAILALVVVILGYGYLFFKLFRVKKKELVFLPGGKTILFLIEFFKL